MNTPQTSRRGPWPWAQQTLIIGVLCGALCAPCRAAPRAVDVHQQADAAGSVEVVDVSGDVDIDGWDKPEVAVSGTLGPQVERLDVTRSGTRVTVRVILPNGRIHDADGAANLHIHVPARSALEVSLVSANLHLKGVAGAAHLQTVSGDISGESGAALQASTISGDVKLTVRDSRSVRVHTISGNMVVHEAAGEVNLQTVSGSAELAGTTLAQAHLESVSGDLRVTGALAGGGQLEASSVSGDVHLNFASPPDADFDAQSFSGEISNCFGPKPTVERYGPGTRLVFRSGAGSGHVRVSTKSGSVEVCGKS